MTAMTQWRAARAARAWCGGRSTGLLLAVLLLLGALPAAAAPALWRYGDEDTTVYLFGTVHLMRADTDWRDETLDDILARVDHFVFEVSQEEMNPIVMQQLVMQKGFLPAGRNLSALLPAALRQRLKDAAGRYKIPEAALERMRPWYAALQITVAAARAEGLRPEDGVDVALMRYAAERGVPSGGLETVAEQLDLFAGLALDDEIAFLEGSLDDAARIPELVARLESAWLDGRVEELAALLAESLDRDPDLKARLLTDRNRRWVARLKDLLARPGTHFVAVGAAHLAGPANVVELLAKDGVAVERLR